MTRDNLRILAGKHQQSDDFDRHAFVGLHHAAAGTAGAIGKDAPFQAGADALPGHFDQAERAGAQDSRACSIAPHGIAECSLDVSPMAFFPHIDEIIDDHASEIAQPQLSSDLFRRGQIQLVGGFFGGFIGSKASAIDVDGHQCFGRVDHDRTAAFERDFPAVDAGDFLFQLVLMEQWFSTFVQFQPLTCRGMTSRKNSRARS